MNPSRVTVTVSGKTGVGKSAIVEAIKATLTNRGCKLPRIPSELRDLVIARDEAKRAHHYASDQLQAELKKHVGCTFGVEGVLVKVCGKPGELYLRRMVSEEEGARLRTEWLVR